MIVVGLISGTSHDGIDCAVVDIAAVDGGLEVAVLHSAATRYDPQLRGRIIAALPPSPTTVEEMCKLDTLVGQAFGEVAAAALAAAGPAELIVSHGQTVFHWVDGGKASGTLQLGQPAWIAERTGVPVVADIRARDVAAGGHGAPLASTIDALLLAGRPGRPAGLNLGGISNATIVGSERDIRAWDIGPANALMDAVVHERSAHHSGYDEAGRIAASGSVDQALLQVMLDEPYYRLPPPKSTGKELFHGEYVGEMLRRADRAAIGTPDLLATLAELTVRTVSQALTAERVTEVFVSGGGLHNPVLMAGLRASLPGAAVQSTDVLGLPGDDKEAVLMALLGWMTVHGVPGTFASATGAVGPRLLGSITPGAGPLLLPRPAEVPRFARVRQA